ncbi:MAG: hypothetical protein HY360_17450 [Verrucomicrobia bacterium]|nr:hypothetical protein [Verrucomicrobiota bacterium]
MASLAAIKALKQETVLVCVEAEKNEAQNVPSLVRQSFSSSEAGAYIPITVVTDAEINKVISIVPFTKDETERHKRFREAEKQIRAETTVSSKSKFAEPQAEPDAKTDANDDLPRTVVCKQDVEAFNVSDPKQALGKFLAGSLLTIESRHAASGMMLVVYKQPNGTDVRALCRAEDLNR